MIRDEPIRSELIRPGLAIRVDPVRSLHLPLNFGGKFAAIPTLPMTNFTLIGYHLHYVNSLPQAGVIFPRVSYSRLPWAEHST